EATALPATSPICGWVVPNNLDSSLMFYAGSGEAIGTMTPSGDGVAVVWQDAPGTGTPSGSVERAFAGRNPMLKAFALRVVALGGPLDRSVWGFPKVEFPLLLGSLSKLDDGLVGFFVQRERADRSWETDFDRFYAAAADGTNPHVVKPAPDTVTLALGAAPKTVTMLVDPRCKVHAFNGVTRVKALDIPLALYASALAALSYTFLTSPVLAGAGPFAIPVPLESDRRWTWVTYDGEAWRETDIA